MPRNGSGTYTLPAGNPVVTGTTISSTVQNNTMSDVATALTGSIAKDGQTTPTANLPMGTYRHTNVGNGIAATDYAALGQTQSAVYQMLSSVSGVDTITATLSPTLTAYAAGNTFRFVSAGANTGAVTIDIDSIGAKSITKLGSTALVAGDIPSGAIVEITYDGTQFQLVGLAAQTAASLNSGATAVTQSPNDNSTKIATTAYVDAADTQIESISASVGSSALTISAGALNLSFRSTTLGSGTVTKVAGTPSALVISSGSTLGTTSGVQSDIVVLAINNAGTIELAAVNLVGGNDLSETGLISTTAEGGAGAADSASVIYSTTARTNVAYRVLGILRSTQATAGTWATAPSLIQGAGGNAYVAVDRQGMVKLNSGTVSSAATLDIVMTSYTGFVNKLLVFNLLPVTDGVALILRTSTDGGSTFPSGATDYQWEGTVGGVTTTSNDSGIQISAGVSVGNASTEGISANLFMYYTTSTARWPLFKWEGAFVDNAGSPVIRAPSGAGGRKTAEDTDAIRLLFSSGNISSGTWTLYGYN